MNKEVGIKLIIMRLDELGYMCDIANLHINDYIDDINDIMYEYNIEECDVEDLFTYKDNYNDKKYTIDEYDGIHLEEEVK